MDEAWSEVFDDIVRALKHVQYLYVGMVNRHTVVKWPFKEPSKSTFLRGLLKLKDLSLRIATVILFD